MKFMPFATQLLNVIVGQAVTESLSLFSDKLGNSHCNTALPVEEKKKLVLPTKFAFYKQALGENILSR
jgi:hypothetical protein